MHSVWLCPSDQDNQWLSEAIHSAMQKAYPHNTESIKFPPHVTVLSTSTLSALSKSLKETALKYAPFTTSLGKVEQNP
jgi:hypothetical protein